MSEQHQTSAEILSRLGEIESGVLATVEVLRGLERQVNSVKLQIQGAVEKHQQLRREHFERALQERKSTWCTGCRSVVPESEVVLCLVEGVDEVSGGYQNSMYGFEDFARLHRVCSVCRRRFADRHGWQDEQRSSGDKRACFYAYDAEKREDGLWVRRFGSWVLWPSGKPVEAADVLDLERGSREIEDLLTSTGTSLSLKVDDRDSFAGLRVLRGSVEIARSGF